MIYLDLFWSFFQIGLFSIGGGYAAIPLLQQQVIDINGWITMSEFVDIITIAEMTPGPVAINSATFVGIQVAGLPGAIIATIGCILPSSIIVTLLAIIYSKYKKLDIIQSILATLKPAIIGLIAFAGFSIFNLSVWGNKKPTFYFSEINYFSIVIFCVAFFITRKYKKINPIVIMAASGISGIAIYLFSN